MFIENRTTRFGKNLILPVLFLIVLGGVPSTLNALNPQKTITQYRLDTWSAEQDYPLNVIFTILQSREDYLWLGTREGLVRFNGSRFKVFNKSNTKELKCDIIRALCRDRSGTLWIGTLEGGLSCLRGGKFYTYEVAEHPALKGILAILEDEKGTLWIGTMSNGLTNFKNGRFTTYTTADGMVSNQVRALLYDKKGGLWIGATNGLTEWTASGRFISHRLATQFPDDLIYYLYEKSDGEILISTVSGLYRRRNNKIERVNLRGVLPNPKIITIYEDRDRNVWLGTDGGGLIRLKEDGEFETFSIADGLKCGNIFSFCEDREGSLWIGTLTGGLHRLRDTVFTIYTSREGLPHDSVYCIHEDRAGTIRIGSQGGISRLKEGKLTLEFSTRQGLLSNTVYSVLEDAAGGLWIGTQAGLHLFKDGKISRFTTKEGLSDNRVYALLQDRQGAIWIGTFNGLNRYQAGAFAVFNEESGLTHHTVTALFEDRQGNLWVVTENGLNMMHSGEFITYTTKEGLVDNSVECIHEDEQGIFYIGTRGGLSRLAGGRFFNFTSRSGLITSRVNYISEDDMGYLWLAGPSGISRVKKRHLEDFMTGKIDRIHPVTYNEQDGLKTRWIKNSGLKSSNGRLWFATEKGAVSINPVNIKRNTLAPPVVIEELIVDGEQVNINRNSEPIVIPPGKKRLEFFYTGLSFVKPGKMMFKLKLTGYDSDWINRGSKRSATYTGLSPGKYSFTVTACNSDGTWNEKGSSLSLYLEPHWYQTWWAYLFSGLFLLLAVAFFVKWRSWKHVKEKQRLEQIIKERTKEIEDKNFQLLEQSEKLKEMDKVKSRFFANISHEFRTPLTLIMGPLEQLLSESSEKEQRQKIAMMLRNSRRLLGLINQLLDLSRFESGKMKLAASRQDMVPFLRGIVESFDSLAAQNELALRFHSEAEEIFLYYDNEKLENVMCNLLVNAIKFTPPGGEISVTLKQKHDPAPGFLQIAVSDTGIGIASEQLQHIFDRFYQAEGLREYAYKGSGIGLALTKELVALHHGEIEAHSEEGKGSEFIIRLPLGDTHLKPGEISAHREAKTGRKKEREILQFAALEAEDEEPEATTSPAIPGKTGKNIILVVDDSADVRSYIRGAIEPLYRMIRAKDGEQGIRKAREVIPDLIISDIMMPGIDGYELCKTLKKDVITSHIPIILLTARADEENIIKGLETGADDYITKPFNTKILLARIRNLIDIRGQLQENLKREMSLQPVKISVSDVDKEFLNELRTIIEDNLADPDFNVDQLCKKLYMSHTTLYRKIQALTGETPTDFLRSYRLKKGAELLKSNFGSVLEVALEVGFSSANYFTKCFKKKFHQLPSDYQSSQAE